MNILVRNLSRGVSEKELMQMFVAFGKIKSLNIVTDAATGKSKGFGFVEMAEDSAGAAAIKALDGRVVQGQKIRVKTTARPSIVQQDKPERPRPAPRREAGKQADKRQKAGTSGKRRDARR
jgi:RNA recognition motif-containing protein